MNDISVVIKEKKDRWKTYAPFGTKSCKGICDRDVVFADGRPMVVCNACKRIVMESK